MVAKEICRGWLGVSACWAGLLRLCVCMALLAAPVRASIPPATKTSDICRIAASLAARETGVPLNVLLAVTLTETGRSRDGTLQPWPWTVNMEGAGRWFENRAQARNYAEKEFRRGARSFDIGCFQINYKWHGQAFDSVDQMFDPMANARYAAQYLLRLLAEKGDWKSAVGAYHSRTPKFARKYSARFMRIYAGLGGGGDIPAPAVPTAGRRERPNGFPLLQAHPSGQVATGSLVSLTTAAPGGGLITVGLGRLF